MDINELNKMSVTALFSKLTSQINFGSEKGFAGLLSRAGSTDLLPGSSDGASQAKPVENKASKPRSVELAEEKPQSVSSKDKKSDDVKNKKIAQPEKGKTIPDEKTSGVKEEAGVQKDKSVKAEDAGVAVQTAAPVAEILIPAAEAVEVNSFEGVVAVSGIMADGAAIEGVSAAVQEAEALPGSGVTLAAVASVEDNFVSDSGALSQVSGEQKNAMLFAPAPNVATDVAELDVPAEPAMKEVSVNAAESVVVSVPMAEGKEAEGMSLKEDVVTAQDNGSIKVKASEDNNDLQDTVVAASAKDGAQFEAEGFVEVKNAGHQVSEAKVSGGDKNVKEVAADDNAEIQAAQLEEMLDGKQLKVSVDVKEEKIAYHANRSLVKDRLALEEAVAELDNAGENAVSENVTGKDLAPAQIKAPVSASQPAAVVQQAVPVEEAAAKGAAEVSKIAGVSGNTAHAAAAGGAEYANLAKNEADAKTNEASFRDVFKGMAKEAVEQVKVNITKSAVKGIDSINVRLKPEELGHIEVKMQIKDGKLQAQIVASRPETMEALQREAQVLEKAFNEAGFQTDENSLNFSCRNDGQQAGQNQGRENPLRDFIGEVFETEANGELLAADAANQNWSAEKGLNIKV